MGGIRMVRGKYLLIAAILVVVIVASLVAYYALIQPTRQEGGVLSAKKTVVIQDFTGRNVTVKVPVDRIVVLSELDELAAVGGEDALRKLVALNIWRYKQWRPDWWEEWVKHFPWLANLPDTGQVGQNFNPEVVINVKPDVVICWPWQYNQLKESGDLKKLEEAGIRVIAVQLLPITTNITEHLNAVSKTVKILGVLLGKEQRAEELIRFYEEQINKVVTRTMHVEKRPKVLVFATSSLWTAYGMKGYYHVWVTLAGGVNLGDKVVKGSSGDVDPEFVINENPDVIIFTCNNNFPEGQRVVIGYTVNSTRPAKEALKGLINRPKWEELQAVKNGRIYLIHHGFCHEKIFQFFALQYLAKWLHPELFKDLNPYANLQEFYNKFMPFPLRGVLAVELSDP
jgi:iron complex transport system substrate-binding protein